MQTVRLDTWGGGGGKGEYPCYGRTIHAANARERQFCRPSPNFTVDAGALTDHSQEQESERSRMSPYVEICRHAQQNLMGGRTKSKRRREKKKQDKKTGYTTEGELSTPRATSYVRHFSEEVVCRPNSSFGDNGGAEILLHGRMSGSVRKNDRRELMKWRVPILRSRGRRHSTASTL